jgi:hypothetical protein
MAAEFGEVIPQGLKPLAIPALFGTTKVVPFQNIDLFRAHQKSCPFKTSTILKRRLNQSIDLSKTSTYSELR